LVYCLAAYAGLLVPQRKWNDLMDTLIGFARSSRPDYTSLAVRILTTLVTDLEKLMEANIGVLVNLLEHVLPIEDQSVRAASLEYFGALLSLSSDDESFETMINLIPSVLQTILKSAESRDFTAVVFGVDAFIAIAEAHPLFLKTHLIITFDTMLAITEMPTARAVRAVWRWSSSARWPRFASACCDGTAPCCRAPWRRCCSG
jgi:hypothetical protein